MVMVMVARASGGRAPDPTAARDAGGDGPRGRGRPRAGRNTAPSRPDARTRVATDRCCCADSPRAPSARAAQDPHEWHGTAPAPAATTAAASEAATAVVAVVAVVVVLAVGMVETAMAVGRSATVVRVAVPAATTAPTMPVAMAGMPATRPWTASAAARPQPQPQTQTTANGAPRSRRYWAAAAGATGKRCLCSQHAGSRIGTLHGPAARPVAGTVLLTDHAKNAAPDAGPAGSNAAREERHAAPRTRAPVLHLHAAP